MILANLKEAYIENDLTVNGNIINNPDALLTDSKNILGAINEVKTNIGNLGILQTANKDSLVNAINNLANAVSTLNSNLNDKKTLTLDNITIPSGVTIEGGYAKVGRLVYVSIIATVTDTSRDYRISGFPKALRLTALACHVPERCNT